MRPSLTPKTSLGRSKHVIAVVVTPDSVALEVLVAQQIFGPRMRSLVERTGDDLESYEVVLCGERPRLVLRSGADLGTLADLSVIETADTVIVPGIEDPLSPRSPLLLDTLRQAHASGKRIVSFCGGAFIIAQAGILNGRRATTHWLFADDFRQAFPDVRLEPEHLYVSDGDVFSSGGVFSATDLSLHLLSLDLGHAYASDFSRVLVSAPQRQGGQSQFFKASLAESHRSASRPLQEWLREHLHEPLTLAGIASHLHLSQRTVMRRFRSEVGLPLFDWIVRERVERAKGLLESTDLSITDISATVGFGSPESLRRNFERSVGTSPRGYRATFRAGHIATLASYLSVVEMTA